MTRRQENLAITPVESVEPAPVTKSEPPPSQRPLAERITWILHRRQIGQRELSRRAGLDVAHIGQFLARARKNPEVSLSTDSLAKIAEGAKVSLRWLATGEGPPELPGQRLQELREAFGMEPEHVARESRGGLSPNRVRQIEGSQADEIVATTVEVLARAFQVPKDAFARSSAVAAARGPFWRGPRGGCGGFTKPSMATRASRIRFVASRRTARPARTDWSVWSQT